MSALVQVETTRKFVRGTTGGVKITKSVKVSDIFGEQVDSAEFDYYFCKGILHVRVTVYFVDDSIIKHCWECSKITQITNPTDYRGVEGFLPLARSLGKTGPWLGNFIKSEAGFIK